MKETQDKKKFAASLSIISNTTLIIIKFIAGIISGSIGIISEAIHSGSDLLASIITYFSVVESSKPADKDHQFGHGKYEDFTSLIEGILILLASFYIIQEAIKKIIHHSTIEINAEIGLWVMLISVIANILVSTYLFRVAKETDSVALFADGEHLRTDVFSSLAVLVGLLLVKLTGNPIYDPIVAVAVAIIIFIAGYRICVKAKDNLVDTSLYHNENKVIEEIINNFISADKIINLKTLRTRKAGAKKHINLTLIVKETLQINQAHELCDEIESKIEETLKNTDISIHLEPNA